MQSRGDVTRLLADLYAGKEEAADRLIPLIYDELHALAAQYMRLQKPGHTLQTTALVHEAFLKMGGEGQADWESRVHFMRVAAKAMRSVLVDHERRRQAHKRGGDRLREPLIEATDSDGATVHSLLDLDLALGRLADLDAQTAQVVELRFFGGLSVEETASALGISPRTVKREWRVAKAWLKKELSPGEN